MAYTSVGGERASGQDLTDIPDRMQYIKDWAHEGVNLELYVDSHNGDTTREDGRLLAITSRACVCAATIADACGAFTLDWTGALDTDAGFREEVETEARSHYRAKR